MKRIEIALVIGMITTILLSSFTTFAEECDQVRQSVVRLHILANSDTDRDQQLKLMVRDAILTGTADVFSVSESKEQAEQAAVQNLARIEQIARDTLAQQDCDYPVHAELVNMFFNTRQYGDTTMPAGRYDAVRVEIGEARGKNWWCVMFPPMCIPAATPKSDLPLEQQIEQLGETPHYVPKFAIVEAIESLQEKWNAEQ